MAATAKHYAIYSAGKGAREGMARCDPHPGHFRPVSTRKGHLGNHALLAGSYAM